MTVDFLGLRTAIYRVPDLERAREWYGEAFGAEPYFDDSFYVGFNVAGYELGLMRDETSAATKTANVLTYWGVDDVERAVAHLVSLGAAPGDPPTNVGGDIVVATVTDPWGNALGLIFNPGFRAA